MILVFFILLIIIFITLSMLIVVLSKVKFEVKKLHISNVEEKLKVDLILNIGIYFFNKLKIVEFTIDNYKLSNLFKKRKLDINKLKQNYPINKEIINKIRYDDFVIEYLKLEGYFGTFNPVISSWIYGIINTIIPIIIAKKIEGNYINKVEFLNTSENKINIRLNCIISIKMVNIMNILHYLKKKGGKDNGESSDRRAYAYSDE